MGKVEQVIGGAGLVIEAERLAGRELAGVGVIIEDRGVDSSR